MKRTVRLILLLLLYLSAVSAQSAEAKYQAEVTVDFQLREEPGESSGRIALISKGSTVLVTEYAEEWSKIIFGQKAGWAKSRWLSKFVALDPFVSPVPGHPRQIGIATIITPLSLSAPAYAGNTLNPGDIIAVSGFSSDQALVNVSWEVTGLPKNALRYEAFVPWQTALPGDLMPCHLNWSGRESNSLAGIL